MSELPLKTPLFEEHLALGARMTEYAGWALPLQYSGIKDEHLAVRHSAGIFDVGHMAQLRVFGAAAGACLQNIFTNDLLRLSTPGEAQYTLICDDDGGIIEDLIVYRTGDFEYLLIVNAANRHLVFDWINEHIPAESQLPLSGDHPVDSGSDPIFIEVADESDRASMIALQGPASLGIIRQLLPGDTGIPNRFTVIQTKLDTIPVLLARTGYTGEDGFEILCHASHAAPLWRALLSFPEITPCGIGARDTLRLEMGYHLYGNELDRGVDPVSAGLMRFVALEKGDFIGRSSIERIRQNRPPSLLAGLRVTGVIPRRGMAIMHEGAEVGKVASGTYSPTLSTGIATAYLPSGLAAVGTRLDLVARNRNFQVEVVQMPFVRSTSLTPQKT